MLKIINIAIIICCIVFLWNNGSFCRKIWQKEPIVSLFAFGEISSKGFAILTIWQLGKNNFDEHRLCRLFSLAAKAII
jgi:hypothetical protein